MTNWKKKLCFLLYQDNQINILNLLLDFYDSMTDRLPSLDKTRLPGAQAGLVRRGRWERGSLGLLGELWESWQQCPHSTL